MTDIQDAVAALRDGATPAKDLMDIAYAHPELGAQVAGHPNAYPGLLDWLRQYGTPEAKQAVAALTRPQPPASPARDIPPAARPLAEPRTGDAAWRAQGAPQLAQVNPQPAAVEAVGASRGQAVAAILMALAIIAEFVYFLLFVSLRQALSMMVFYVPYLVALILLLMGCRSVSTSKRLTTGAGIAVLVAFGLSFLYSSRLGSISLLSYAVSLAAAIVLLVLLVGPRTLGAWRRLRGAAIGLFGLYWVVGLFSLGMVWRMYALAGLTLLLEYLPDTLIVASMITLAITLPVRLASPNKAKATASVTAAAPAVPLYVMATMPDGSQQMVQVAQSSLSLAGTNPDDAPSGGFATLGFFIPMVGLILFLMWKDQTPLKARSAGKGALAGVITSVGLTILIYVIMFVVLANLG